MSDEEAARRKAAEDYRRNQQTQMKTEQQISSSVLRETYNAELAHRRESGNKG